MGPFDSCRLIHLNLTSFVDSAFTEDAKIDLDKLYKTSYEAMRLADDLVDLEVMAVSRIIDKVKEDSDSTEYNLWSRIKNTAILGRRAGLGITGIADVFAMMRCKYGSEESFNIANSIMEAIFLGQLDSTIDMSIQRGAFINNDSSLEYKGSELKPGNSWYDWLMCNYPDRTKRMIVNGRRNISWSTVAPVGTVSIMARCSSGIEPVFLPFYERKRKCMNSEDRVDYVDAVGEKYTVFIVVHSMLKKYVREHLGYKEEDIEKLGIKEWDDIYKESPWYGSIAPQINWNDRVYMQSVIQKYITHSISSTINLPNSATEADISTIYSNAWAKGNKGQTIYRDGCREGILNKLGSVTKISGRDAPKRPATLEADYHQVKVRGEQFIVLIGLLEGKPYEVFAFRPLRPVNIATHRGTITKVGKMHYKYDSEYITLSDIHLANENVEERATTLYSSMLLRHGVDIKHIIKVMKKVNENIVSFSSAVCRVLSKYITEKEIEKEKCPECGGTLVREGGCIHCMDCCYSKCM